MKVTAYEFNARLLREIKNRLRRRADRVLKNINRDWRPLTRRTITGLSKDVKSVIV